MSDLKPETPEEKAARHARIFKKLSELKTETEGVVEKMRHGGYDEPPHRNNSR